MRFELHFFFVPTDVNDIYPEVSSLKDPELQSAQLAAKARFLPDYTVRAVTNIQYLRITAEHYLLARRLTAWVTKLHPQGKLPPFPNLLTHPVVGRFVVVATVGWLVG